MARLFVITGASRGIGAALARLAAGAGHHVLAIARSPCPYGESLQLDLASPEAIERRLPPRLLAFRAAGPLQGAVLVNNAATIEPIGTDYDAAAAMRHMAINLVAPIVACRVFLRAFADLAIDKRIVNITSGAAQRAFDGWSLYGAGKAGLDHFGRCLALEQQRAEHPVDVVSLSPGVVDTDMQARIRGADAADFPQRPVFDELKSEGRLADPQQVASRLLEGILGSRRYDGAVVRIDAFGDEAATAA